MAIKPDSWIRKMPLEHKMIEPFAESQVRNGIISFGVSSYGYDIRISDKSIFELRYYNLTDKGGNHVDISGRRNRKTT